MFLSFMKSIQYFYKYFIFLYHSIYIQIDQFCLFFYKIHEVNQFLTYFQQYKKVNLDAFFLFYLQ